jgi:hypothetical protein
MFCLLYSPKQRIVKFHAQKQIGKSHVIDIWTSEDMENISLCIFQYLTLYYIINIFIIWTYTSLPYIRDQMRVFSVFRDFRPC